LSVYSDIHTVVLLPCYQISPILYNLGAFCLFIYTSWW